MRILLLLVLLGLSVILSACAGSFEAARGPRPARGVILGQVPSHRCQDLDSARTTYGAAAKSTAVLGGAGAVATIPDETRAERVWIAAGALLSAAVAAFSVAMEEGKGESWARECSR